MPVAGWNIKLDTGRNGIAEKLAVFKAAPDVVIKEVKDKSGKIVQEGKVIPADQSQLEDARASILKRIEALPEKFDGVLVIASGQQDLDAGRSNYTIQVFGKIGHI